MVFPGTDFTSNAEQTVLKLEALRKMSFATSATIIFAPENNLSHYTAAIDDLLKRKRMFDRNLVDEHEKPIAPREIRLCNYVMYRVHDINLGVITKNDTKIAGTNKLHGLVLNHRLFVWQNMMDEVDERAANEWKTTIEQMANWSMTPNINGTYVFGANGLKTDHIMALLVGIYAIWNWNEGKARDISLKYESTCCLCNCATGLCGRRTFTKAARRE